MATLTDSQIKKNARSLYGKWNGKGDEKQDTISYWSDIFTDILGIYKPTDYWQTEKKVIVDGNQKYIDIYIPETQTIIEQKSFGKPLDKPIRQSGEIELTPYEQAKRYNDNLPKSEKASWLVLCNFQEIWIYNMESMRPEETLIKINLLDLQTKYNELDFLVNKKIISISEEEKISKKAGDEIGKIYDAILKQYHDAEKPSPDTLKSLNMLCVRLVFCFYAEDSGLFGHKNIFTDFIAQTETKNLRKSLLELFEVLDQDPKKNERDPYLEEPLCNFPYVNGGLFTQEDKTIPQFNDEIKDLLLESGNFTWEKISPTIFGAVFESTLNQDTRRSGGMHYTSIENIHKVIDPLFMNDLNEEFDQIKDIKIEKNRNVKLNEFQQKLGKLKFFDPACGSGNFLTESFMSLRRLENECLKLQLQGQSLLSYEAEHFIKVDIHQFYGIEINDFAVSVAKTALWIADSQMKIETMAIIDHDMDFLPLVNFENIVEGNALQIDWSKIGGESLPLATAGEPSSATPSAGSNAARNARFDYIMGNPPFVGHQYRNESQMQDMKLAFYDLEKHGKLDYVCAWYNKAADLIKGTKTKCAFVSTNSICQGESVSILWGHLFSKNTQIDFAYKSFIWDSESTLKAHVHCVIIGFSCHSELDSESSKYIYDSENKIEAKNINGYLVDASNIFIESRGKVLTKGLPEMTKGSQPTDGGNLIFSEDEKNELIKKYPESNEFIKKFIGAEEFINNKHRYCLWLKDISPIKYMKIKPIMERIEKVKEMRLKSPTASVKKDAERSMLFTQIRQPDSDYLIVPETSSENRRYIPIGFMTPDIICSNSIRFIPNATLSLFGILTSSVHMAWMRVVCGRLKSDYRYSPAVYNNFPFPTLTDAQKTKIEKSAQAILDARAKYADCSLADLYGENMYLFPELVKAHQENDKAVKEAYSFKQDISESEIVAELFKLYEEKIKTLK